MKTLLQFLKEAESQAATQARKLNLKSDGHGGWYDNRGEFVAKTEKGKLKFYGKNQKPGEKDEPRNAQKQEVKTKPKAVGPVQQMAKRRADDDLAGAPLQKKPEEEGSEKEGQTLTTAFGRFNPPTTGHEKLLKFADKKAAGGDLKIYPSRSQDNKKNPLDPDMKVSYMRKMFPDFEKQIVNDSEMRTIFDVLKTAASDGYKNVKIIVGADRLAEFQSLAHKYNGDLYDFEEIEVLSAGERTDSDDDSEDAPGDVTGMKSSKLRKYVMDDDFEKFKSGMPADFDDSDAQALFDAVRTGMKVKKKKVEESYELWEIAPKLDPRGLREQYINKKIFNIGDLVENLNTGLVGNIIRRSTNHLICVTEDNIMFKSWTKDLNEYSEVQMKRRMRLPGKPNTLYGTTGYRKNAQDSVPGQKKILGFNIKEFINKYRKI